MAVGPVAMRCPVCGSDLRVRLAPEPPTQWFPCPHCRSPIPVVVPRDPPPLYTWEVLPNLYPPMVRPRVPRWRARRAVAGALLAIAVIGAALAAVLVYDGVAATEPARYTIDGTVDHAVGGTLAPVFGANVLLTDDNGATTSVVTGASGTFSFASVVAGGVTLNVTATGFAPLLVATFVSPVYGAQATGLELVLTPGGTANESAIALAPFPDLEQFVASLGSGAVLLGIIALVAGAAAIATVRHDRPALGVVGGASGVVAPLVLFYLSLSSAFPILEALTAVLAGAGAFALTLRAVQLAQTGPAPDFR
ncbi:MAG TPA: carboxypeptidase-like regulatory domain-containing protein [Thermoplasmata archaeon]|nr:carboxypeptidase-like regulatory domain-containing protein [Thermoplasmata archaeon]